MSTRYPNSRMRRMRADEFSRELQKEHRIHVSDLIYPVFVMEGYCPARSGSIYAWV